MSTVQAGSQPISVTAPEFDTGGVWGMLYDMPAWGISLLVHIGVLMALMSITWVIDSEAEVEIMSVIEPEDVRQEEYVIDTEVTDNIGSKSDLNIVGPSMAAATKSGLDNHLEVQELEEQIINPRVQHEALPMPNEADLLESINLTGTTEHAGGTEGAIDRLTQEIASSLRERKTLVVWLFDESLSMESRREAISKRFESVYRQLGVLDVGADTALKSGVIGYGSDVHVLQGKPTSDIGELMAAVNAIQNDVNGVERVFAAIDRALKVFLPEKRRMRANMMLIIVTDERGDDYGDGALETIVKRCTREGVKAYCVGNASVFGREQGQILTKWEADGETFEEYLPADMGPETVMAEGLQLPFWTASGQDLARMSSGYGPYTMSRLCAETGGIFFLASDTQGRKWDPSIMRQYAPDYRPIRDYQRELSTNHAKSALVNAAQMALVSDDDITIPQLSFQANNDNILRQQMFEAQKPLATLDFYLNKLQATLEVGEKHRDRLDSDRWRASYDLAMGRVLAMRVRAYGYNAMLAEMKSNPKSFEKEGNNRWDLEPSDEINAGASVRRLYKKATEYLNRVIDEHPGTPWAFLAKVELNDPLGWRWKEGRMQIASNNRQGNGGNRPIFTPEEEAERRELRRRQQKKIASRPKL